MPTDPARPRPLQGTPPQDGEFVIPAGQESVARDLIAGVGFMRDLEGGYVFNSISLDRRQIVYTLARRADLPDGPIVGRIKLLPIARAAPGQMTSKSFALSIEPLGDDPRVSMHLDAAARSIVAHDRGGIYASVERPNDPTDSTPRLLREAFPVLGGMLLAWAAVMAILVLLRRKRYALQVEFKQTHVIPAILQTVLFLYWGFYSRSVLFYLPILLLQLAFAFAFDALLGLTMRRRVGLAFGPVPIVLSTNLFVQFAFRSIDLSFAIIALAILSKACIQRDGRHIFNPSAFGITVVGGLNILFPMLGNGDVSSHLNLAPSMSELILLLALVVQFRLRTVLVSLFALLSIELFRRSMGIALFTPLWAPILLAITLLATDPATIPQTGPGRALYGAFLGFCMVLTATLFVGAGISDFYAKVIPIALSNLLAPAFDRLGRTLPARPRQGLDLSEYRAHIAGWLSVCLVELFPLQAKTGAFNPQMHIENDTPLVVHDRSGAVRCADNPIFCKPFAFFAEISAWFDTTYPTGWHSTRWPHRQPELGERPAHGGVGPGTSR